jgi:hypothetical protein
MSAADGTAVVIVSRAVDIGFGMYKRGMVSDRVLGIQIFWRVKEQEQWRRVMEQHDDLRTPKTSIKQSACKQSF